MNIHTVAVARVSQLEVGGYYLIRGTMRGWPVPPQVLHLERKELHPTLTGVGHISGTLWWRMWDRIGVAHNHLLTLYELNIPEHGAHSVHLERIDPATVHTLVGHGWYRDVQQELSQRLAKVLHP